MNDFLENNYKIPVEDNYLKITEGTHRIRIVSRPIIGFVQFIDKKPIRSRMTEEHSSDAKHFWAVKIWNYEAERVQIWEIAQKSIQKQIKAYADNPKWGSPLEYDLVITREGTGQYDTEYSIMPDPKEKLDKKVQDAIEKRPINLDALFSGADPFAQVTSEDVDPDSVNI